MKIAIIADPLDNQSAGVHIYTKGMVEALIRYKSEHNYFLVREKRDHNLPKNVQQIVVPSFQFIPLFASFRLFILIPLILRLLRVHVVIEPAHFGPFNLPKSIRRITVIHDLTPLLFPQYHRWHGQILQRLFLKRILKKTNFILTVSQYTAKDLKRIFPFTIPKTTVIPPGHDPFFKPTPDQSGLEKWQIETPYFLSVGTIEPRKNLLILLDAYQRFRDQNESFASLLIVGGKGWKYQSFYKKLAQYPYRNDIHLLGYVDKDDLPVFYTHSLALIYPSLYEGFGLPVLEAMSCGTSVICSNRSSLPEVGGDAALYFEPENSTELLELMQKVIEDKTLGKSRKQAALKQAATFSWEKYAHRFDKVRAALFEKKND